MNSPYFSHHNKQDAIDKQHNKMAHWSILLQQKSLVSTALANIISIESHEI
jgi:hypothetical protein